MTDQNKVFFIRVDQYGNAYVSGKTASTDFPKETAMFPTYGGGSSDAFVTKIEPQGSSLVFSTYLGGDGEDDAGAETNWAYNRGKGGIFVDYPDANVYVAGYSGATWGSPERGYTSGDDVFAVQLNGSGVLAWHTFLGGTGGTARAGHVRVAVAVQSDVKNTVISCAPQEGVPRQPTAAVQLGHEENVRLGLHIVVPSGRVAGRPVAALKPAASLVVNILE